MALIHTLHISSYFWSGAEVQIKNNTHYMLNNFMIAILYVTCKKKIKHKQKLYKYLRHIKEHQSITYL
jgi:hypothetical protein